MPYAESIRTSGNIMGTLTHFEDEWFYIDPSGTILEKHNTFAEHMQDFGPESVIVLVKMSNEVFVLYSGC